MLLLGCIFMLLVLLMHAKSFCKKQIEFKTALITSFKLLLKLSFYKHEFFNQSFPIITIFFIIIFLVTIFFNYYNPFQSSQSLSIIIIFFIRIVFITIFLNLFTTCDTIFMKISQRINSII